MPKNDVTAIHHSRRGLDKESIKRSLENVLTYAIGKDHFTATHRDWFHSAAISARDRLTERWMETMRSYYQADAKRVYYLSLEFLTGRLLSSSLLNLGFYDACREALVDLGLELERIRELENDAALGNGGLGRLAACFLDSMATLNIPGYGYGIRYEYGMFTQRIENGFQVEHPDNWLRYGNPWEFPRPEVLYPVHFGGRVVEYRDDRGNLRHHWVDTEDLMAMAFDTPVPGYGTDTVNNMRLWSAKATRDFNLKYFNEGNYIKAVEEKNESENLSKVLYPDDTTQMGRELRLKQQYFFVCATLQDILRRLTKHHAGIEELPNKVAIQMNDTHPSIAVPELMRILLDVHHLEWDQAWDITRRTISYTNHTLMPEALETWPVKIFGEILPRHLQIIYEINRRFLDDVRHRYPGDADLVRRVSLIDEEAGRRVRMANLSIVGSHRVNGVSQIHTELMKDTIFADFERLSPGKIINITNGITPRRWLHQANPGLSRLITSRMGGCWLRNLACLAELRNLAADASFRQEFRRVKEENKKRLAESIEARVRTRVNPSTLFDIHAKRIHEYKRQLLNLLHVVTRYNRIRAGRAGNMVPRTVIFGGKAAPGYAMAKLIIKLIHDVADVVNNDPKIGDLLKVVFLPNYNVSNAEKIIPACDLSEQISTAGTEASGTGNMKFALNGALTIGTLDGANIEMRQEVGEENFFLFGLTAADVAEVRAQGYNPWHYYNTNDELRTVLDMIGTGYFSADDPQRFRPVVDSLTGNGDYFLLLADYESYITTQEKVDALYRDPEEWSRRAILNVAGMGRFSSDRSIQEYAERIWQVQPVQRESATSP
ncbi:MAG: glycogen/starch/alpha-glucan phosphorylase [Nitrospiraceae bacterium]|nr:glycogen/starch/alpha-glucan phosphorylase [Nitrospiraceae bacterium]